MDVSGPEGSTAEVTIRSFDGRLVWQQKVEAGSSLQLRGVAAGPYIVVLEAGADSLRSRMVVLE